jgi:hypothetical protein
VTESVAIHLENPAQDFRFRFIDAVGDVRADFLAVSVGAVHFDIIVAITTTSGDESLLRFACERCS